MTECCLACAQLGVGVCILNLLDPSSIAPMELDLASRGSQGGGVYVEENAVANFEGCNIHDNTASIVCLQLELSLNFQPSPRWNVTCAHGWQAGGGLYIRGTATLTNINVYSNQAASVCSPFNLSL